MKIVHQLLQLSAAAGIALAFVACNNSADSTTTAVDTVKKDSVKVDTVKPAPQPPAMPVPFDIAEVNENLKDFASWKITYDSTDHVRKDAGLDKIVLAQVIDKPNTVQAVYKIADPKKVTDFFAKPEVKTIIAKAGVIGKSEIVLLHVIRFNTESQQKQWVEVTHKVKNFDAWLKVFDAEGKDKRLAEGLIDIVVARGTLDSNLVHLVFDVKEQDLAKAKAAIASDEKKKLMTGAGVIGVPKIVWYKQVD